MTCGVLAVVLVGVLGAAYVARTNHRAISVVKRVSADIEGKASKAYEVSVIAQALAMHGGAAGGGVASDSLRLGILMTCGVLAVVLVGVLGAAYVARTNHRAISVVKRVSADIEGKASKANEVSVIAQALAMHGGAVGGGVASDSLRLGILMTCGVLAVVLVGVLGAAYVARTNHRAISVVKRVSADIEGKASKAYEELCRQRMAGGRTADGADSGPISSVINTINQRLGSQSGGDNQSPTNRSSTSSWSEEPLQTTDMDVTTGHAILRYLEEQLADQGKLDADWKALEAYQPDQVDAAIALKQDNRSKNRYPDVLPYDHALVSLRSESAMIDLGGQGVEYINASPLCDHDPQNPIYIAAQAPLVSTAAEFWQMIWEQGSVVVVNLTQLNGENGDALCHRYWPDNGSEVHGIFEVHLVSEHIWCEDYLVRSFYLKNMRTNETRTVTQFHFLSWRDNSVPPNTKSLLEFRSDGAGRTGTYCLLDMILNRINKGVKEMDAAATLEHLRDQRMRLVRTKAQYELVLACIAEEVNAMLKAL